MIRPVGNVRRAMGASTFGVGVALACAGSTVRPAQAWPNGAENRPVSPFVVRARRGEVAVPALEKIEQMCALLTSCDKVPIPSSLFPPDFQGCVAKMTDELSSPTAIGFSLTMRECGLQADSCASLGACALHGSSAEACRGRGPQGAVGLCDVEGRALTCWHDAVLAVRDCPRGGEQCVVFGTQATCTLGLCPATAQDNRPRCSVSGTHLVHCDRGRLASLDCSAFGLKCAIAGDGAAGCATTGPPCTGLGRRCDGNVEVGCFNGHEVRVDCAAGGLACVPSPGATAAAACGALLPVTGGCDASDAANCDGDTIHYCHEGQQRAYACRALGFRKCDASKNAIRCAR